MGQQHGLHLVGLASTCITWSLAMQPTEVALTPSNAANCSSRSQTDGRSAAPSILHPSATHAVAPNTRMASAEPEAHRSSVPRTPHTREAQQGQQREPLPTRIVRRALKLQDRPHVIGGGGVHPLPPHLHPRLAAVAVRVAGLEGVHTREGLALACGWRSIRRQGMARQGERHGKARRQVGDVQDGLALACRCGWQCAGGGIAEGLAAKRWVSGLLRYMRQLPRPGQCSQFLRPCWWEACPPACLSSPLHRYTASATAHRSRGSAGGSRGGRPSARAGSRGSSGSSS